MERASLPPGPSSPSLIQGMAFWTRPLASLERWRARYGKRFTIRLPVAPPFVMHSDPADVKQIFTAPPDVLRDLIVDMLLASIDAARRADPAVARALEA